VTRLRDANAYAAYCDLRAAQQAIENDPETAHAALRRAVGQFAADAALEDLSREVNGLADADHPRASDISRVSHRLLARIVNDTCTLVSSDR
jgi:23S rRNA U2552 (ribose-2'-O)-methylase RlmE/FtsJ